MLKLEPLYYLNMIHRFNSIKLAAENIPVAPSTISSSLHKLETNIGIPLLAHTYRGVELTETAKKIAEMTNCILKEMEKIEQTISSVKEASKIITEDNKLTVYMARGDYKGSLSMIMQYFSGLGFDASYPDISCCYEGHLKLVNND